LKIKTEEEGKIGIIQYLSSNPKFLGITKKNYFDFIVNEVDLEKKVIRVTDEEIPTHMIRVQEEKEKKLKDQDLLNYFDQETTNQIQEFLEKEEECVEKFKETKLIENDYLLVSYIEEKEKRTELHKIFKNILESDVFEKENEKFIRLRYPSILEMNKKRRDIQRLQSRNAWPKDVPDYLEFYLEKENKDTTMSLNEIALKCGFNIKVFTWAGTKDKRFSIL
jgi:tRNA pseudouridine13 synthase